MVRIYPKQFPSGTIKILHVRSTGPFKILNKLNCNTYVINLPRDYGISCTFNVNDLVDYKSFTVAPWLLSLLLSHSMRDYYLSHSQILIPLQRSLIKF